MRIPAVLIGLTSAVLLSTAAMITALPSTAHAQDDAGAVMKKVKATLDGLSSLSCSFAREYVWKELDRTQRIEGTIRLKNPGKLRVEYPAQTIVTDGKTAWTYTPRNKQVTVTRADKDTGEYPSPQSIFRKYAQRKAVLTGTERVGGRETDVVHLLPGSEDEADVTVWIDRTLSFPVRTVEKFPNGDTASSELSNVAINGKIKDDVFTFKPPEGVSVVDMRE
jgi:outer membrane lipoprotein carrier protein